MLPCENGRWIDRSNHLPSRHLFWHIPCGPAIVWRKERPVPTAVGRRKGRVSNANRCGKKPQGAQRPAAPVVWYTQKRPIDSQWAPSGMNPSLLTSAQPLGPHLKKRRMRPALFAAFWGLVCPGGGPERHLLPPAWRTFYRSTGRRYFLCAKDIHMARDAALSAGGACRRSAGAALGRGRGLSAKKYVIQGENGGSLWK